MNKKIITVLTAGTIALSANFVATQPMTASAASSVSAASKISGTYVTKTAKNVYHRANVTKIGKVSAKTKIKLTHKRTVNGKTWYKISYNSGKKGWVLSTNLTKLTVSSAKTYKKQFKTTTAKTAYKLAGGHNAKAGVIKRGAVVKTSHKRVVNGKNWYKVKSSTGLTGWVTSSNLKSYVAKVSNNGSALIAGGAKYLGVPYVWGGTTPSGFDCSGFTSYVYKQVLGKTIPRTSGAQYAGSKKISKSQLKTGDLVFFSASGGSITHVAMYAGNGKLLHAAGNKVHYQNLAGYWDRLVVGYGTYQ
ncbi:C40 family peptidase [Kurthia sibirica]|nr:NlpC/P60 family protein [Kurthia sibirica]GEK32942.1 hypothetical protein KSI01_04750 [Kurthia sibirica]